jgi:hypothetical protein
VCLPVILELTIELAAAKSDDGIGPTNGPEHAGLLAAATDNGLAAGFDDARADEPVLTAEFGIAHTLGVVVKVTCLSADLFGQLWTGRIGRAERGYQMLDLPFIQHVLVNHHPASLFSLLVRIQFVGQIPEVLTGVIQIDNLNGTGKMLLCDVPNPFRSSAHHDLLFRAALA